jgi:hypothetical protein
MTCILHDGSQLIAFRCLDATGVRAYLSALRDADQPDRALNKAGTRRNYNGIGS